MRNLSPLALTLTLGLLAAACGSASVGGGSGGSGGSTNGSGGTATGGSSNSGGSTGSSGGTTGSSGGSTGSSGGSTGAGGVTASGGSTGSGGNHASGGTTGSGGSSASGGAAGNRASGGSTGSGGAGGATSGSGGTTPTGSGGSSGAGVFFSDDFESDTSGKQPTGWDNLIAYNHNATNPMGSLSAVADATHTHNSSKLALHVASDGSMVFLERQLPTGTKHFFVRAYFYMTHQLGMDSTSDNHESLVGISSDPSHTELRFGQMKGAVGVSLASDDNLAPPQAKWNMPPIISANAWHCIEVEFDGTAAYNALNAWSDGTSVFTLTQGSDWGHSAEPATWMSGLFDYVQVGWESFSSEKNDVWIDDLVMSSGRIGCN